MISRGDIAIAMVAVVLLLLLLFRFFDRMTPHASMALTTVRRLFSEGKSVAIIYLGISMAAIVLN